MALSSSCLFLYKSLCDSGFLEPAGAFCLEYLGEESLLCSSPTSHSTLWLFHPLSSPWLNLSHPSHCAPQSNICFFNSRSVNGPSVLFYLPLAWSLYGHNLYFRYFLAFFLFLIHQFFVKLLFYFQLLHLQNDWFPLKQSYVPARSYTLLLYSFCFWTQFKHLLLQDLTDQLLLLLFLS